MEPRSAKTTGPPVLVRREKQRTNSDGSGGAGSGGGAGDVALPSRKSQLTVVIRRTDEGSQPPDHPQQPGSRPEVNSESKDQWLDRGDSSRTKQNVDESSTALRSTSTSSSADDIEQQQQQQQLTHVYPDVIIVERGKMRVKGDASETMTSTQQQHHHPVVSASGKTAAVEMDDSTLTPQTHHADKLKYDAAECGDMVDSGSGTNLLLVEDCNSLKDYTFMYKKQLHDACTVDHTLGCRSRTTDADCVGGDGDTLTQQQQQQQQLTADTSRGSSEVDDISSISSSIVDYVRRSLSEAGCASCHRYDDVPPPLPAKTSQRRAESESAAAGGRCTGDLENVWEPTHMTWEEVLTEAQMLGIPLGRTASRSTARSESDRRSSYSSSSSISHRSTPAASPIKRSTMTSSDHNRSSKRGSSTPGSIGRDLCDVSNKADSSKRTNKFNIKNLLTKIANSTLSTVVRDDSDLHRHRHRHRPFLSISTDRTCSSGSTRRSLPHPDDIQHHQHHHQQQQQQQQLQLHCIDSLLFQQQQQQKRSLSASGSLRRARINDSTSSIGSTISQFYPGVASLRQTSPSPGCSRPKTAGPSLRSSAGSVLTAESYPDSCSTCSLGSVFSQSSQSQLSSSTGASPALWTPFTPCTNPDCSAGSASGCCHSQSLQQRGVASHSLSPGGRHQRHGGSVSPSHRPATHHHQQQQQQHRDSKSMHHVARNMEQLKNCGWYWGAITWEEAEAQLANQRDGSFLLRDSSDDRYLFSVSFRALGAVHHTRIEHYKGAFSFSAQTLQSDSSPAVTATTIVDFIQQAMVESHRCRGGQSVFNLQPRPPGLNPIPVRLLFPVSRFDTSSAGAAAAAASDDCVRARHGDQADSKQATRNVTVH